MLKEIEATGQDKNYDHIYESLETNADTGVSAIIQRDAKKSQSALLTTVALSVHSLVEGVAMGASLYLGQIEKTENEASGSSQVGFMIMIALFLHKGPEAAGYGTFIVHMNCKSWSKVIQIAIYSIASPFSAFIAFAVFESKSQSAIEDPYHLENLNWWTGFTLLIAVGTLIYITLMLILPEVYFSEQEHHEHHAELTELIEAEDIKKE